MVKSSNGAHDLNKLYGPEDLGSNPGLEKFLPAKRFQLTFCNSHQAVPGSILGVPEIYSPTLGVAEIDQRCA